VNETLKKTCKNYNVIVNCEFLEDDLFSRKLVSFYKTAVERAKGSDSRSLNKIAKIDKVMRKYIEDYSFSKKLRNSVDVSSILMSKVDLTDAVLEYAVDFSDRYEDNLEESVVVTRWIWGVVYEWIKNSIYGNSRVWSSYTKST